MRRPGDIFRGGLQFAGGSRPAAPIPNVYGLGGYTGPNLLGRNPADGPRGSAAGFYLRIVWWTISVTAAAASRMNAACFAGAGTGYRLLITGTNNSYVPTGFFTGAASVGPPPFALTAAHVGKLMDHLMVWDQPAGQMRGYYQGASYGATPTGLTYLPNAANPVSQGERDNGTLPADQSFIVGIQAGDGFVPTPGEVAAAYATSVANAAASLPVLSAIPGKTTWLGQVGTTWNPPVIITDAIGGQNLSMLAGSAAGLSLQSIPAVWAP